DGSCVFNDHGVTSGLPAHVHLQVGGTVRYQVRGGVFRTLAEARRVAKSPSPFAHVGLLNRYASERCQLTVVGLGRAASDAFASATDLGTGLERPMPIEAGDSPDEVSVSYASCPPRTLLRVYWRLERE